METSHVTRAPVKLRTIPGKFREDQHSPRLRDLLVLQTEKIVLATDWANQCVKVGADHPPAFVRSFPHLGGRVSAYIYMHTPADPNRLNCLCGR